jgi:signal transduction histidine kinase
MEHGDSALKPGGNANPKGHILLVDDDAPILEAVSDFLQINGYAVITALDGAAAMKQLEIFMPDVIISDIMMPVMDGYEFFEKVRLNPAWGAIPFIFLTARGQKTDIRHGYQIGADDFIVKPFEAEDLIVKVDLRLRRARDIRALVEAGVEHVKDELLGIFGHELRTPLTYIYGYANLLRESDGTLDQATVAQMLDGIHLGAERLVHLTESLLLMVRIDNAMIALEIEHRSARLDLEALVKHTLAEFQAAAAATRAPIKLDIQGAILVRGVEYLLSDILRRLLDNALQFSECDKPRVEITARRDGALAVLDVTDDGIGIDPENHERIFDRFVQIDRRDIEQQGVGLGLALARSLARLHGGDLTVISQKGKGSTFRLTIPLAPAE